MEKPLCVEPQAAKGNSRLESGRPPRAALTENSRLYALTLNLIAKISLIAIAQPTGNKSIPSAPTADNISADEGMFG